MLQTVAGWGNQLLDSTLSHAPIMSFHAPRAEKPDSQPHVKSTARPASFTWATQRHRSWPRTVLCSVGCLALVSCLHRGVESCHLLLPRDTCACRHIVAVRSTASSTRTSRPFLSKHPPFAHHGCCTSEAARNPGMPSLRRSARHSLLCAAR